MATGSKSGWFDDEPEPEHDSWLAAEPDEEWLSEEYDAAGEDEAWHEEPAEEADWEWEWEWEWVEEPAEEADEPEWEPGLGGGFDTPSTPQPSMPAGPAPGGPPPASGPADSPGRSGGARGGAPAGPPSGEPLAAPGQERTAEEEREVVTDFAMQQLAESRGHAASVPLGGGMDERSAEEMRDQALQEYMRKKEELERERAEKAERQRRAAEQAAAECAAVLEDVKGLKSETQERILKQFGSLKALQSATVEDLTEIEGVGKTTAQRIQQAVGG